MSYSDTPRAADGGYIPPPPPVVKKGKSPWFFVGMGCLGLFVLAFASCAIIAVKATNDFQTALKAPLSPEQAVAPYSAAQVPIYPKATVNVTVTKTMRAGLSAASGFTGLAGPSVKFNFLALNIPTDVTPEKVTNYYDSTLKKAGWKSVQPNTVQVPGAGGGASNVRDQKAYQKGTSQLMVQTTSSSKGAANDTVMLILMTGLPAEALAK